MLLCNSAVVKQLEVILPLSLGIHGCRPQAGIGRGIIENQQTLGWGESVVEIVASDLQRAFPNMTGFSARNVWYMRRLYEVFSDSEFVELAGKRTSQLSARQIRPQPVAELTESDKLRQIIVKKAPAKKDANSATTCCRIGDVHNSAAACCRNSLSPHVGQEPGPVRPRDGQQNDSESTASLIRRRCRVCGRHGSVGRCRIRMWVILHPYGLDRVGLAQLAVE